SGPRRGWSARHHGGSGGAGDDGWPDAAVHGDGPRPGRGGGGWVVPPVRVAAGRHGAVLGAERLRAAGERDPDQSGNAGDGGGGVRVRWGGGGDRGRRGRGGLGPAGVAAGQPTPVAAAGLERAGAVGAGGGHQCGLLQGGTVRCWGQNDYGQLGDGAIIVPQ